MKLRDKDISILGASHVQYFSLNLIFAITCYVKVNDKRQLEKRWQKLEFYMFKNRIMKLTP